MNHHTFEAVDQEVRKFDVNAFTAESAVKTAETRRSQLVTVYAPARPIIMALASMPMIPKAWRAVLTLFIGALDEANPTFKAGKDL